MYYSVIHMTITSTANNDIFIHNLEAHGPYEEPWKCTKKDTYSWYIFKYGTDWAFNMPKHMKINEQLTNGSEKALDYWFKKLSGKSPTHEAGMFMTITTQKGLFAPTATWKLKGEDPLMDDSHWYIDMTTGIKCWLCAYGTDLGLGGAKKLYLKLTLTNPGTDIRPLWKGSMIHRTSEWMNK